jgi:hypothetical protein
MEFKLDFSRRDPKAAAKELIGSCFNQVLDPMEAADLAAHWLFWVAVEEFGAPSARQIFSKLGADPSPMKVKRIKNAGWLDRFDMMKPKPNISQLARELYDENQLLPKGQRSTATLGAYERQIKRLRDQREQRRSRKRKSVKPTK